MATYPLPLRRRSLHLVCSWCMSWCLLAGRLYFWAARKLHPRASPPPGQPFFVRLSWHESGRTYLVERRGGVPPQSARSLRLVKGAS